MAAAFAGAQPETVVAVTGTNGKTSTVDFLRQLWTLDGERAASLGTLGLVAEGLPPGAVADHARPGGAARARWRALARAGVRRMRRWRRPRTGSSSGGWTACGSPRRASPT